MTGLPPWWALFRTRRTARGALRRIDEMNKTIIRQQEALRGQTSELVWLRGHMFGWKESL